jgi:hypothetical protein
MPGMNTSAGSIEIRVYIRTLIRRPEKGVILEISFYQWHSLDIVSMYP